MPCCTSKARGLGIPFPSLPMPSPSPNPCACGGSRSAASSVARRAAAVKKKGVRVVEGKEIPWNLFMPKAPYKTDEDQANQAASSPKRARTAAPHEGAVTAGGDDFEVDYETASSLAGLAIECHDQVTHFDIWGAA